jgi:hypothetical protein
VLAEPLGGAANRCGHDSRVQRAALRAGVQGPREVGLAWVRPAVDVPCIYADRASGTFDLRSLAASFGNALSVAGFDFEHPSFEAALGAYIDVSRC